MVSILTQSDITVVVVVVGLGLCEIEVVVILHQGVVHVAARARHLVVPCHVHDIRMVDVVCLEKVRIGLIYLSVCFPSFGCE